MAFIVSHKHKFVFCHIPRAAGTSISNAFFPVLGPEDVFLPNAPHQFIGNARKLCDFENYFKFAVLRNPVDRFISIFNNQKDLLGLDSIGQFIEILKIEPWSNFWVPTMDYITENGSILTDFLIDFDNLQDDFDLVCSIIGIDSLILPHDNADSEIVSLSDYERSEIMELYKKDYEWHVPATTN